MMHHHHPWLALCHIVGKYINYQFCNLLSYVSIVILDWVSIQNEIWLEVLSLTFQNVPVIKATSFIVWEWVRIEMVFTDNTSPVSIFLHFFRECPLRLIECHVIILEEAIDMAIFRGENHCSCWAAQGIGNESIVESHAFVGDSVDIRGVNMDIIVCTDGFDGVII
jgi:hypothetical protein